MSTTAFDPFGGSFLADPYPHFARLRSGRAGVLVAELGYWVVSRYDDCRRVLREYETFSATNALAPVTPAVPAGRARRWPTAGSARSRRSPTSTRRRTPAPAASPTLAFTPAARRPDGGVRARPRAPSSIGDRLHDGRADIVAALTWELPALVHLPHPRRAGVGRRRGQGGRREPAAVHVRPGRRGRAGANRRRHGAVLALLRGAGRGPPRPAARRLHVRPRAHAGPRRASR